MFCQYMDYVFSKQVILKWYMKKRDIFQYQFRMYTLVKNIATKSQSLIKFNQIWCNFDVFFY